MTKIAESGSISQRHGSADPDQDPDPHQNVMDPEHCFKVMRICDHWSTDPSGLHSGPPGLQCERPGRPPPLHFAALKLLNFRYDFNADTDTAFPSKANRNLDSAFKVNGVHADPEPQPSGSKIPVLVFFKCFFTAYL
jgi:hypothetical protein